MERLREALVSLFCKLLAFFFQPFRKSPRLPAVPAILILKPCCLGDLLLATPAIAALRKTFPQARIVLATGAWARPAVEGNPHLTEILDCGSVGLGKHTGLRDYWRFASSLRRYKFDIAVVLDRSPLVTLLPWLAGVPTRAGLDSLDRGFSLTHPVPVPPGRHEAQLYLDIVRVLGCHLNNPALYFSPSTAERAWARERLLPTASWIAVHPGGGVNPGSTLVGKRWPGERWETIITRLLQGGWSVVVVGGPEDVPLAQALAVAVNRSLANGGAGTGFGSGQFLDLSGETTFGQLGAVLEGCRLFLGNDTGPLHLAVAVGTPVVATFGPSRPESYGPVGATARVLYHGELCEGCWFRGGLVARCRNAYACIAAITVEEVWEGIQGSLNDTQMSTRAHGTLPALEADASI